MTAEKVGDRVPGIERAFVYTLAQIALRYIDTLGIKGFTWTEDGRHVITLRMDGVEVECAVVCTVTKVADEVKP